MNRQLYKDETAVNYKSPQAVALVHVSTTNRDLRRCMKLSASGATGGQGTRPLLERAKPQPGAATHPSRTARGATAHRDGSRVSLACLHGGERCRWRCHAVERQPILEQPPAAGLRRCLFSGGLRTRLLDSSTRKVEAAQRRGETQLPHTCGLHLEVGAQAVSRVKRLLGGRG